MIINATNFSTDFVSFILISLFHFIYFTHDSSSFSVSPFSPSIASFSLSPQLTTHMFNEPFRWTILAVAGNCFPVAFRLTTSRPLLKTFIPTARLQSSSDVLLFAHRVQIFYLLTDTNVYSFKCRILQPIRQCSSHGRL